MIIIHKRKEFYGHISTCNYYKQLPTKVLKNTDIKIKLPTLYIIVFFYYLYLRQNIQFANAAGLITSCTRADIRNSFEVKKN